MLVTYYFQGEPGESETLPNAFNLNATSPITFGTFIKAFPPYISDPNASLHFRFRANDKNYEYVWLDVKSPEAELPLYQGNLYAKVLRTDSIHACQRYSRLKRRINSNSGIEGAQAASQIKSQAQRYAEGGPLTSDIDAISPSPSSSLSNANHAIKDGSRKIKNGNNNDNNNIVNSGSSNKDNNNDQSPRSDSASQATPAVNLFDFEAEQSQESEFVPTQGDTKSNTNSTKHEESIKQSPLPEEKPEPIELDRAALAAQREAHVQENVQHALEEKHARDNMLRQEEDETIAARAKHDAKLTDWAFDASKKKRNVRTLLTTMQKVLWEGNKWKEVGLGDVLMPKQVKLKYRKAMLVVHPDRLAGDSAETRFIAKRIFEAINEQYQEFLKSESPDDM
jgi:hypothetical protein